MAAPTPPSSSAALGNSADAFYDGVVAIWDRGWPYIVPLLTLRVVLGVIGWWVDWKERRSRPTQLELF